MADNPSGKGLLKSFTAEWYGIPVWILWALGVGGLAIYWRRRKSAQLQAQSSQSGGAGTSGSGTTTGGLATNLASMGALGNLFAVAGLMPYSGGDTYNNTTNNTANTTNNNWQTNNNLTNNQTYNTSQQVNQAITGQNVTATAGAGFNQTQTVGRNG